LVIKRHAVSRLSYSAEHLGGADMREITRSGIVTEDKSRSCRTRRRLPQITQINILMTRVEIVQE
jgi:hypothetical protein